MPNIEVKGHFVRTLLSGHCNIIFLYYLIS